MAPLSPQYLDTKEKLYLKWKAAGLCHLHEVPANAHSSWAGVALGPPTSAVIEALLPWKGDNGQVQKSTALI